MRAASLLALSLLPAACRANTPAPEPQPATVAGEAAQAPVERHERESDPRLDTGWEVRSHQEHGWGLRLSFPVSVGLTDFDLTNVSIDQLATVSLVPTAEFVFPLDERWTLLPFVGLGGAFQSGDQQLIEGNDAIGLAVGGVRITRWQHFGDRNWFGLIGEVRYDAALTPRNGLLGDWGSIDAAVELRRDMWMLRDGARFQGGIYAQVFRYWDAVDLDITGVSPSIVEDHGEFGISLGTSSKLKVLGLAVPRVFIGVLTGDVVSGFRLRFGRL